MNPSIYFLLALTSVLAAAIDASRPVVDIDGDTILHGSYYVLPAIFGPAGGLALAGRSGKQCPLTIGQESSEVDDGIPVKFSNWRSRVGYVPESQNLNIKMDVEATICVQSSYWKVEESENRREKTYVVAGSKPDGYGDDASSFFQIKKAGYLDGYKFVFCPEEDCIDVGIYRDRKGIRRLVLSSEPFYFVFKKADNYDYATKNLSKTI